MIRSCPIMTIRPPDEIVCIRAIVRVPTREPYSVEFPRVGHIFVLQVGSGENCMLRDECLANLHTSIELHKFDAFVTNYDRVMGTILNGRRLHDRTKLHTGDELRCGDMTLEISFGHPVLEGQETEPDPKDELCATCQEPWTRRPGGCAAQPHWAAYANFLESERASFRGKLEEAEKACEELRQRIVEKCASCNRKDSKLIYCQACTEVLNEKIGQLDEAYTAALSHINRDYLKEIQEEAERDSSEDQPPEAERDPAE